MSEYRHDPLHERWVIVSDLRAGRPHEFDEQVVRRSGLCPFCPGNEGETPPALAMHRLGSEDWVVRVVPNKYPAVKLSSTSNGALTADGLFASRPASGQHEVIIETPRHVASLSELTDDECTLVFRTYQERLAACQSNNQLKYAQIFKNVGPAAGASIEHSHSQLLALPQVPIHVAEEVGSCRRYYQQHGRTLLTAMLEGELCRGERMVAETPQFVAFCPWASRFPYEVWIVPRRPQSDFTVLTPGEAVEVSRLTRDLIGRIESALGNVGYNYLLHTQPFDASSYDYYHWHIELFPRTTKAAGFEWSTGMFINTVAPETAAAELRRLAPANRSSLTTVPTRKTS